MEKKVSYLMLLLCLFLFPFRVHGLEVNEVQDDEVLVENKINDEKTENLEDLVEIEDPEEVLVEDTSDKNTEEQELGEESTDEELNDNIEDATDDTTDPADNDTAEGDDSQDEPSNELIELSQITVTGVISELIGGEPFTFGATSAEADKYSVVREEWYNPGEITKISTSDENYNNALPEGYEYIASPEADKYYHYQLVIRVKEGYELSPEVTLSINGSECNAYWANSSEDTSLYLIDTDFRVQAKNTEEVYVESLDLVDVVTDAYIDQSPLYGASTTTEHFSVFGELWTYFVEEGEGEDATYTVYTNASDSSLKEDYEIDFDKFEEGKTYSYIIVVDAEKGYRLAYTSDTNYTQNYKVTINGEESDCEVGGYKLDDNTYRYYIFVVEKTPTEAATYGVTENADPVVTEGEISDVSMTVDAPNDELESVYVDGTIVSEENYTTEGNTILTLLASFLNTLGQGIHDVTMRFVNGNIATTTITIESQATEEEQAATPMSGQNTSEVAATYTVQNMVDDETVSDNKLEVKEQEKEEEIEEEQEESNLGLIIFLIILILIAIIIPITIYRKNND